MALNCRPGDLAVVVRSEAGNEGRVVLVVRAVLPGESRLADGTSVLPGDDWIVQGRLRTGDTHTFSCGGQVFAEFDTPIYEFEGELPFPDAFLRPLRDNDGTDEMLRIAGLPQDHKQPQEA